MKKLIIIPVLILIAIIAATLGIKYATSFHKVSISLGDKVTEVAVYNVLSEDKIKDISQSGDISLQNGDYYLVPSGENIDTTRLTFVIDNTPKSVSANPGYSKEYLQSELVKQLSEITKVVQNSSPLMGKYQLDQPTLYKDVDWFGSLVVRRNIDPQDEPDYYRVVAHKVGGTWKVIGAPELVLTKEKFNTVPTEVLSAINRLRR